MCKTVRILCNIEWLGSQSPVSKETKLSNFYNWNYKKQIEISKKIMLKITFYVFSYKSSCKKFDQERAFPNSRSSNHSKFKLDPFRTEKIRSKGESEWVLTPSCVKTLAPLLIKVLNASRTRLLSVKNFAKHIKNFQSNSKLISLLKSD